MAHPYISGAGNIAQMISQLRKNFPASVTSETVKRLGIAPNNESYVINALQFLGIVDEEGKKTKKGADTFSAHKEDAFRPAFENLLKEAYKDLFELHGDDAWKMDRDALIHFFRTTDQTSAAIGGRQAAVFQMFAGFAGHGEVVEPKAKLASGKVKAAKTEKAKPAAAKETKVTLPASGGNGLSKRDMALTVRVEINLPADGTRETYDAIFQSIKANLLNE